jgi:hypothetical protein
VPTAAFRSHSLFTSEGRSTTGPQLRSLRTYAAGHGASITRRPPTTPPAYHSPVLDRYGRHGVAREVPLVVETLRAVADGRVLIANKRVLDAEGRAIRGYDLTEVIEARVGSGAG